MPRASIIIPCYNAATFVADTIASAQAQTVRDVEIICVDDGSTDDTLEILDSLSRGDRRIRIVTQANAGEGPARDAGLDTATGDWLYFLDSDDLMEPTLLERAIARCEQYGADLVVFQTFQLDMQTDEEFVCPWSYKRDWLAGNCFRPREHPHHLFNSFQNWVHNKLFRASFVRSHDLHMQHVHRTADLLFTCRALAEADTVALLDEPLHHYRVNNPNSAMRTSDSYPLDFYEAFLALRASLEESGTWDLYHDSFVNWAIEGVITNLRFANSYEGYKAISDKMRQEGLKKLDIVGFPPEKSDMPVHYAQIQKLIHATREEELFELMLFFRSEWQRVETDVSTKRLEIEAFRATKSYKLSRVVPKLRSIGRSLAEPGSKD